MENKIKTIVEEILKEKIPHSEYDLYELGADSLSAIKIVCYLEEEFNINIEDDDLDIDNFVSLNSIKEMIEKYV